MATTETQFIEVMKNRMPCSISEAIDIDRVSKQFTTLSIAWYSMRTGNRINFNT